MQSLSYLSSTLVSREEELVSPENAKRLENAVLAKHKKRGRGVLCD